MQELRIDPLTGLRVLVADERGERPGAWPALEPRAAVDRDGDPFAEGNEDRTPPELYAVRPDGGAPDGPGWTVRVVPNAFPALGGDGGGGAPGGVGGGTAGGDGGSAEPTGDPLASGRGQPELLASRPATGAHEVIVNSPRPVDSLLDLGEEGLATAMEAWRERLRAHAGAACRHLIVNEGGESGASLAHTHAQLFALPFVPAAIARERERFTAYHQRTQGRNLLEDLLTEEVRRNERVVIVDREAIVICPFAAAAPFQLQLIPRRPAARFEDAGPLGAAALYAALQRLAALLGALPPFNLWLRTAPSGAESFCWRIDLMPRLNQPGGLELGAGLWLNAVAPERAAESLRAAGTAAA